MLCMMAKLGYGAWDELKAEIRKSWRFRFDWFFKSRTPQVGARLCSILLWWVRRWVLSFEGTDSDPTS